MPRQDGTGPDGFGPRTGRGLGHCADRTRSPSILGMRDNGDNPGSRLGSVLRVLVRALIDGLNASGTTRGEGLGRRRR